MKTKDQIIACVEESYPDDSVVLFDGLEGAFLGVAYQQYKGPVAVYDRAVCIEILVEMFKDEEDPQESAEEYFQYNTEGAWVGENTPLIIDQCL